MKRLLICILALFLFGSAMQAGKIYVVCVGVSDYPGEKNDLELPVKDATALYNLYWKYVKAEAVLIMDADATKNNVLGRMKEVFSKAEEDDSVVFFFSGHGYAGGLVASDNHALEYSDLKKVFSACKARNKMIFADACHSGTAREAKKAEREEMKSVMLFLSSRGDEVSFESGRMKNGYFTAALLGALKGGADFNRDRIITARELFTAVSETVKRLSHDNQHPVMWGNFDDDMPVMTWKKGMKKWKPSE